jgi:putative effector of murein hydrolase LrgA (UPF0299 family)
VNQLTIFFIRAVVGLAVAAIVARIFFGRIDPVYVLGLAIIMIGLAYLAEYHGVAEQNRISALRVSAVNL